MLLSYLPVRICFAEPDGLCVALLVQVTGAFYFLVKVRVREAKSRRVPFGARGALLFQTEGFLLLFWSVAPGSASPYRHKPGPKPNKQLCKPTLPTRPESFYQPWAWGLGARASQRLVSRQKRPYTEPSSPLSKIPHSPYIIPTCSPPKKFLTLARLGFFGVQASTAPFTPGASAAISRQPCAQHSAGCYAEIFQFVAGKISTVLVANCSMGVPTLSAMHIGHEARWL